MPSLLEPAHEQARAIWLARIDTMLTAGVDGIDIRSYCHHNGPMHYLKYAFAQPTAGQATHTRFTIPRIPVDERDDERRFGLKLRAPVRSGLLSPLKPAAAGAVKKVLGR